MRNALFEAGIFTDIPSWVSKEHLPEICSTLGLKLHVREGGGNIEIARQGKYIILEVIDETVNPPKGHYSYTENIEEEIMRIKKEGREIIAIIEITEDVK